MTGWFVAGIAKKSHDHVSGIARGRAHAQADLGPATPKLLHASYFTYVSRDDIGSRVKTLRSDSAPARLEEALSKAKARTAGARYNSIFS